MKPAPLATLWAELAELPLVIERCRLERLELETGSGWTRITTVVHLDGGGVTGSGEDVSYGGEDQEALQRAGAPDLLVGARSLGEVARRLDGADLFPAPPSDAAYRDYRRWAFESAALDLALRQAGSDLATVSGRTPRPVTFVYSCGLGSPVDFAPLERRREHQPDLGFKLDAGPAWTDEVVQRLAAMGCVRTVDLKGYYSGTPVDQPVDLALYRRVAELLPEAVIEDGFWSPETEALLGAHAERLAWDAPLHGVDDVRGLPIEPRWMNSKPSRFGSLESLFAVLAHAEERGMTCYGGGQFELGVGRRQIQELASLFHPDGPNDVAPAGYHREASAGELPRSPLAAPSGAPGFGP